MESILSELSELSALPEEDDDSMETHVDAREPPKFPVDCQPTTQTEEIGVLVLMMGQLLECVKMGPMLSVHIVATKCAERLDKLTYLINTKGRKVTTEEVIKCLILHQSIKGLINACPHTFIVAQLEDYIADTQQIIASLYSNFKEQIADDSSDKNSVVTMVKWHN